MHSVIEKNELIWSKYVLAAEVLVVLIEENSTFFNMVILTVGSSSNQF